MQALNKAQILVYGTLFLLFTLFYHNFPLSIESKNQSPPQVFVFPFKPIKPMFVFYEFTLENKWISFEFLGIQTMQFHGNCQTDITLHSVYKFRYLYSLSLSISKQCANVLFGYQGTLECR